MTKPRTTIALLAASVAMVSCSQPPTPMPWHSTAEENIDVIDSDYDVSRFWSCGWSGKCPRKTWTDCLHVTPLTDDAAMKWYRVYYGEDLQRARAHLAAMASGDMRDVPIEPVPTHSPDGRKLEQYEIDEKTQRREVLLKMERFRRDVQLLDTGDPDFRAQVIAQMKQGVLLSAHYVIAGSGADKSVHDWSLSPHCYQDSGERIELPAR